MGSVNQSFSIPKKKVVLCIIIIVVIAVIAVGGVLAVRAVAKSRSIGEAKAEQIALADAGVDASEANLKRTEFSFDDWHFEYEVEFYTNNGEYEYTIAASDGRILDRDIDMYSASIRQENQSISD